MSKKDTIAARTERIIGLIKSDISSRNQLSTSMRAAQRLQSRRMQALELFRPFPYQDEFLFCGATEILVQGGTRSGKSTIIGASVASYALNRPLHTSMGCRINMREERFQDKPNGEIWVIGKQMNHSSTIYRLLFEPGAFQIVKDKKTNAWRAWRPGFTPGDDAIPEKERKPSPPFIYPSEVSFGWEKMREKQWNTALLPNGWTIKYFPSNGQPKRGDPVHRIWIDEEIENDDDLYPELQSRLSDYSGKIWWSSWPANDCEALLALKERAVADMDDWRSGRSPAPDAYRMLFAGSANPIIDKKEVEKRKRGWSHEIWVARDVGEFTTDSFLSYPDFSKDYHRVDYGDTDARNDKLTEVLRANNYIPPSNWCVYLIIDPGTQRPGLLWVAIPPEEFWYKGKPYFVPYREFTGRKDADQLAYLIKSVEPTRVYQRFVMDFKAGEQTPMGHAATVMANYSRAFAEQNVRSVETGTSFQRGEQNWVVRSTELRRMMQPVTPDSPRPALRIVTHQCPQLILQIQRNRRHVQKHDVQDKQASGQVKDLLDTLEYFAGCHPEYKIPVRLAPEDTPAMRKFNQEQDWWNSLVVGNGGPDSRQKHVVCGVP